MADVHSCYEGHCGPVTHQGDAMSTDVPYWKPAGEATSADVTYRKPVEDQPPPTPSDHPAVWDLVVADIRDRDAVGVERYGTRLRPHNGRDPLIDAYQEALDLVVYLRQAIYERDR